MDVLDVNAGLPELDEPAVLTALTEQLQAVTDLPLQLDSADPEALARALRVYNGKAIMRTRSTARKAACPPYFRLQRATEAWSSPLRWTSMAFLRTRKAALPSHGASLRAAQNTASSRSDFLFDPLTLTISSGSENARVTLECVRRLHDELGVCTSLGVSNVSFGLPARGYLNANFFALALGAGLSAAILNPHAPGMMEAARACTALSRRRQNLRCIH